MQAVHEAVNRVRRLNSQFLHGWRVIVWSLVALGAVWAGILVAKWPFTQGAVITALQNESGRSVRAGDFRATFFPLGYVAEDLRFEERMPKKSGPVFTIRKLAVVARYSDLLLMRKRVKQILISGLHIIVPAERPSASTQQQTAPGESTAPLRFSEIGQVKADDAVVEFRSSESDPSPLRITLKNVTMDGVTQRHPASFRLEMLINEPRGTIRSTGQIGPWNSKDDGKTFLAGSFTFERADLSSFEGIGGSLNARGKFAGPLNRVACDGSIGVSDFHVSGSTHQVPLSTAFRATVNGLNADTTLEYVESHLGQTTVLSHGVIKEDPQRGGKAASLQFSVDNGQIEDLLLLFTRNPQPSMTGTVSLQADVDLPPGSPGFLEKLQLQGDFGIGKSRFTKPQTQAPINRLSKSAEGLNRGEQKNDERTVLSNLKGHVSARGGLAILSSVSFEVPGAHAKLQGTYNLLERTVNLKGVLWTTGTLSHTTYGLKAAMLKVITPFLKKHSVTIVPFTITGPARNPGFALNLPAKRHA
jgi:hypothetical protein